MAASVMKRNVNIIDKVILVTGGAAGVGAGVVRALVAENARHVIFLDISTREGNILEGELLNKFGPLRAKFIQCDISNETELSAAYQAVLDKYRRLDIVINSAAILSADDSSFKKIININFTATVSSTLKAIETMSAERGGSGGTVVNISSLLALNLSGRLPVYSATKTAVHQFSIAMGSEEYFSKSQVHIITVCLGPTDTAILQRSNSDNFKDSPVSLTSRVPVRQRVESAVKGILEVIDKAKSGSTWIVENDKPAYDFSHKIAEAYEILSNK